MQTMTVEPAAISNAVVPDDEKYIVMAPSRGVWLGVLYTDKTIAQKQAEGIPGLVVRPLSEVLAEIEAKKK